MIVPILTSQGMVSTLVDVQFYLERAAENLADVDARIKCDQIIMEAESVLSDFVQFYEEQLSPPPQDFWDQIVKNWCKEEGGKAELAVSMAFSSIRFVDSTHAEKCSYPEELRSKAKRLGDRILDFLYQLRGFR